MFAMLFLAMTFSAIATVASLPRQSPLESTPSQNEHRDQESLMSQNGQAVKRLARLLPSQSRSVREGVERSRELHWRHCRFIATLFAAR